MNAGTFFNPNGRLSHGQFMTAVVVLLAISAVLSMAALAGLGAYFVSILPWLVVFYCWVAIWSKRLHNANVTGWMTVLLVFGFIIVWSIIGTVLQTVVAPEAATMGQSQDPEQVFAELESLLRTMTIPSMIAGTIVSGAYAFIVSLLLKNDPEENKYGPAPS